MYLPLLSFVSVELFCFSPPKPTDDDSISLEAIIKFHSCRGISFIILFTSLADKVILSGLTRGQYDRKNCIVNY
jgi:hypothetical protein